MTSEIAQSVGIDPLYILGLIFVSACLPFFLTLTTAYIKVIVVTYLIRNALGVQQVPPTMVLASLALILSIFVMAPVGLETYQLLNEHLAQQTEKVDISNIFNTLVAISDPLRQFLIANTDENILHSFIDTAHNIWPNEMHDAIDKDSFVFIIPSYVISELTKAFEIGFLLYLPFIAIDLIISNILLAMGMMMVSPMTISLPFKLMLFVTLEGWLKLTQGLMYSYTYV